MANKLTTLIVDDNKNIRFFLEEALDRDKYNISSAENGEDALNKLRESSYDLILLDLNLGGRIDGLRVLEAAKWRWPDIVVVILTAYGTLDSALSAIREGVDGYLLKPVEPSELRQVVEEALSQRKVRRSSSAPQESETSKHHGGLSLDPDKRTASLRGETILLSSSEFELLNYLIKNEHRVVSAYELVKEIRNYTCDNEMEARKIIKWYIHKLRKKIETDPSNPRFLINVRGKGYTFGLEK